MKNQMSRNLAASLMATFCAMMPSMATEDKPMGPSQVTQTLTTKTILEEKLNAGHAATNKLWQATLQEADAVKADPELSKAMNALVQKLKNDPEISKAIGETYSGNDSRYEGKTTWFVDCWPTIESMVARGESPTKINQAISKNAMQPMQTFLKRKRTALKAAIDTPKKNP